MSEQPVKVLYFVDRMLRGGIQTFVYENQKHMDPKKVHIDYLLLDDGNHYEMEEELKELGSNIYILEGVWPRHLWYIFKYCRALDIFFKEHRDYKVVHMHSSSKNFWVLKYAKKYGIKVRIAHAHSVGFMTKNKLKILIGNVFKVFLKKYATDFFACSNEAGRWLFGKNIVKQKNFRVVHNAVDLEKFIFNKSKREEYRKKLGYSDSNIVIGNVGRFSKPKNHLFLIDVFKELIKNNDNYRLLLVGKGELEAQIREKIIKYDIEQYVIFTGFKTNPNDYLNAMDLFVFPSKYEGLGLVLIEAQANGLHCFATKDAVPQEAKVTSLLQFIPLGNINTWSIAIMNSNIARRDETKSIIRKSYSIEKTALELEKYYLEAGHK